MPEFATYAKNAQFLLFSGVLILLVIKRDLLEH